ncbi:hypothetical protein [Olleya sp. ITB9]|uniref:hypothetical protein n=1 Tax=Olleya sp. ITB9 TaxID=1715648 RepID=UPI0006D04D5B|nr:hypothetical protein [Olleya sp. ITB9]
MKKLLYTFLILFSLSLVVTGCREEKSTEETVEKAIDDVEDGLEDASDEVEEAMDDVEDNIDDTVDDIED